MDLHRSFTIREHSHRILNPFTDEKLAALGRALALAPGSRLLDLACGKGELLSTWARDHGVTGVGVDISTVFLQAAAERAAELGVSDRVTFKHADASSYAHDAPVDVACCIGATWIGNGVAGTIDLLARNLVPGGMLLVGEPYWRLEPPDDETVRACHASSREEFRSLPELIRQFGDLGWDLAEMMLASQDSWDRYEAPHWLNVRRWLAENPDDELADSFRAELRSGPLQHVMYQREYFGWGVFALMAR